MTNFTTNLSTNPSFQLGMVGYTAIDGSSLSLDTAVFLYGNQSLQVNTPGTVAGEGVSTPQALIASATLTSYSIYLIGTGNVTVSAVSQVRGVLATAPATLSSLSWQRVTLNQISCSPGELVNITVTTTTAQEISFQISGIQIEPESPANPYCDGDQVGCFWTGGVYGSTSYQPFANPVLAASNHISFSNIVVVLAQGAVSTATPLVSSERNFSNLVQTSALGPVAALTDFGIFELTDPDPAQTYAGWNSAGLATGTTGFYTRNWGVFIPPLDYYASGNQKLWSRADKMSVGWQFASVLNNGTVNITNVQTEVLPITTGFAQPYPSVYDPPRMIHTIIKPNRLNYVTNPSFETNITGWTAFGSASLARSTGVFLGNIIVIDDVQQASIASMNVTVNANGDGAETVLSNLIAGDTYTVSAYLQAGAGLANISLTCDTGSTSIQATGGTGYGTGTYGGGTYGGVTTGADLTTGVWFRVSATFTASSDTVTLLITANAAADVVYPTHFWIDAVMLEPGSSLGTYFEGDFGSNYFWEGTAELSRSYYYDQFKVKAQAVTNILEHHMPMGISYATPLYVTPPTQ